MESTLTKLAQAAVLGLALAFTFSCSSSDDDGDDVLSSSSVVTPRSSAGGSSSPSKSNCPVGQREGCTDIKDKNGHVVSKQCKCFPVYSAASTAIKLSPIK